MRLIPALADTELAALAAGGDRAAYGELVKRHARLVRDLMRRLGAEPSLAEDLTQDAFIDALHSLPGYRSEAPFKAWIRTIATRNFFRARRKAARQVLMAEPVDREIAGGEREVDAAERMDLDSALGGLSDAERMCVCLCHGAGMTQAEISEALDVPLGTVKSHVTRGLEKLRRRLGEAGGNA